MRNKATLYEIQQNKRVSPVIFFRTKRGLWTLFVSLMMTFLIARQEFYSGIFIGVLIFWISYTLFPPTARDLREDIFNTKAKKKWEREKRLYEQIYPFIAFFLILFSVNSFAKECVIYVGIKNKNLERVNKQIEIDVKILQSQVERKGDKFFWLELPEEFTGKFDSIYYNKDCSKIWLIFAGHRENDNSIVDGINSSITIDTLMSILKGKRIFFLGFDVCSIGKPQFLSELTNYADLVAGSPYEEVDTGWKGVYLHFSSLLEKNAKEVLKKIPEYYTLYYINLYSQYGKKLANSGFPCQRINVYWKKGIMNSGQVCYGGNK